MARIFLLAGLLAFTSARVANVPGVRTPQMGYNSWYDVLMSPSSEALLATAKAMTSSGLQAAGYTYLNLDDGIVEVDRGQDGNLVPTAAMGSWKDLSDQLHAQGFHFGVYTDRGPKTCGGRAAAQGFEAKDAAFYAANGVDYVKEDSCNAPQDHPTAFAQYAAMRDGIDATGRDVFFSLCGWNEWYSPVMRSLANSARIGPDDTNWNGVLSDIDDMLLSPNFYGGPGAWSDPCLLLGMDSKGNQAQTEQQSRFQFTAWAVLAAPMLLSQSIVNMSAHRLETYLNTEVIGVGQDIMGRQGILLAGGKLALTPRSLGDHLARRHGGLVPNPRAALPPAQLARMRGAKWAGQDGNTPITVEPCSATSGLQQWQWNVTAPLYVSNKATGLCFNTDDCGAPLIAFTCVTSGPTCSPGGLDVMRFQLLGDGTLRTPSQPDNCLASAGMGLQAAFEPCAPSAARQQWVYSAATQRISTAGGAACLAVGGSASGGTAVVGRPLVDGSWAVAFFNAGMATADVVCNADCLAGMGFEPTQAFAARDLWAHADLPDFAPGANITAAGLEGEGGVALYKLMPIFKAALPPPPALEL